MKNLNYIALDVHKKNIVMAISTKPGIAEIEGEYNNTDAGIKKLIKKLQKLSENCEIKICYEAGPCGFALKRILDKKGFYCEIIAPSLIPVQSGNKIKTDKRDAKKIARLFSAGELTSITVPDEEKESIRDYIRCREDIMTDLKKAKQRLNHFLIRHGLHFSGTNWTISHFKWINQLDLADNFLNQTLYNYLNQIEFLRMQLKEMDKEIEKVALSDRYIDRVNALCAFRGIGVLTAMIIIAEVIDFRRFSNPKDLMAYLGMVPTEYSSGDTIKKGSITKCGNKRVRRVLIEAAHHYRHKPKISSHMRKSLEKIEPELQQAPIKALSRLHKRYFHLLFRGKPVSVLVVAVARELCGFIWKNMILIQEKELLENREKLTA